MNCSLMVFVKIYSFRCYLYSGTCCYISAWLLAKGIPVVSFTTIIMAEKINFYIIAGVYVTGGVALPSSGFSFLYRGHILLCGGFVL
jgi:hypothetical protein